MKSRIAHVTFQKLETDPRVQRAVSALVDSGYDCPVGMKPIFCIGKEHDKDRSKFTIHC